MKEKGNPLKKKWIIPRFYDVTWLIFERLCPVTLKVNVILFSSTGPTGFNTWPQYLICWQCSAPLSTIISTLINRYLLERRYCIIRVCKYVPVDYIFLLMPLLRILISYSFRFKTLFIFLISFPVWLRNRLISAGKVTHCNVLQTIIH